MPNRRRRGLPLSICVSACFAILAVLTVAVPPMPTIVPAFDSAPIRRIQRLPVPPPMETCMKTSLAAMS